MALDSWRAWAGRLKANIKAVALAAQDPRAPWYAKALAIAIVAYVLSPIDLIPDFIPVVGYLDDLVIVPLGIAFVVRLIPSEVWAECRARAEREPFGGSGKGRWVAAAVIVLLWLAILSFVISLLVRTKKPLWH